MWPLVCDLDLHDLTFLRGQGHVIERKTCIISKTVQVRLFVPNRLFLSKWEYIVTSVWPFVCDLDLHDLTFLRGEGHVIERKTCIISKTVPVRLFVPIGHT